MGARSWADYDFDKELDPVIRADDKRRRAFAPSLQLPRPESRKSAFDSGAIHAALNSSAWDAPIDRPRMSASGRKAGPGPYNPIKR